jgi:hypothetical protein
MQLRWRRNGPPTSIRRSSASSSQTIYKELPLSPKAAQLLLMSLHRSPAAAADGLVPPEDARAVQAWFNRHPNEMVVSSNFVDEMNANVLCVLQLYPDAIRNAKMRKLTLARS